MSRFVSDEPLYFVTIFNRLQPYPAQNKVGAAFARALEVRSRADIIKEALGPDPP
jgi:hypothetical protein